MAGEGRGWAVGVLIGTGVCVNASDVLVLLGLCVCAVVGSTPPELLQEVRDETIKTLKINLCMVCNVRLNIRIKSILAYKSDQKV